MIRSRCWLVFKFVLRSIATDYWLDMWHLCSEVTVDLGNSVIRVHLVDL